MFDLRESHRCTSAGCKASTLLDLRREKQRVLNLGGRQVVSKSTALTDITGLSINPAQPNHLALGCNDPLVRIYDRRMLGPANEGGQPLHRFLPSPVIENNHGPLSNVFVNDLKYNYNGTQLLVSYNGHGLFILDSDSLVKKSFIREKLNEQNLKKRKLIPPVPLPADDDMAVDGAGDDDLEEDEAPLASRRSKRRKLNPSSTQATSAAPPLAESSPRSREPTEAAFPVASTPPPEGGGRSPEDDFFFPGALLGILQDPRTPQSVMTVPLAAAVPAEQTGGGLPQMIRRMVGNFAESLIGTQSPENAASPPFGAIVAFPPAASADESTEEMLRQVSRAIMLDVLNGATSSTLEQETGPTDKVLASDTDGSFLQHLQGHLHFERDLKDCAFVGPRSDFVLSGSEDGNLFIWSSSTGALVSIITRSGVSDNIRVIAAPSKRAVSVATIGDSTLLSIWGLSRSESLLQDAPESVSSINRTKPATTVEIAEICGRNIAQMRDQAQHRRGRPRVNVDVIRFEEPIFPWNPTATTQPTEPPPAPQPPPVALPPCNIQ